MTIAAPLSLEQYLALTTKPYSEYVNGEIFQKSVPTEFHSALQGWLVHLLLLALGSPRYQVFPEQHVRVNEQVIRVPDICVTHTNGKQNQPVRIDPPLLCVELISPSDRLSDTVKKCQEYLRWGVPTCWITNPESQEAWNVTSTGIDLVPSDGNLQAGSISIPMADVFPPAESR